MEECASTSEHLALVGFANRLGTTVSAEDGIANDGDLRQQAQLLMHLMSSRPDPTSPLEEEIILPSPFFDEEPSFVQPTEESLPPERSAFSFSCPSLSLDEEAYRLSRNNNSRKRTFSDSSEESIPSLVEPPVPSVLLARPLVVDDRNALRLSAEAMARNILQSFARAVQWRADSWVHALTRSLLNKESILLQKGASQDEVKALLNSSEATVIAAVRKAVSDIAPTEVTTSFKILPHGVVKEEPTAGAPPPKKRKLSKHSRDGGAKYTVQHGMMFKADLGLMTPLGYAQIAVEAPGIIEGSFARLSPNDQQLTGVTFDINTEIVSAMIEKSSRIIVRAAAQELIPPVEPVSLPMTAPTEETLQTPQPTKTVEVTSTQSKLAVISPRNSSPTNDESENEPELMNASTCIPMPKNFSAKDYVRSALRMVSPQPRSPEQSGAPIVFSPQSPTPLARKNMGPSLVSPPPSKGDYGNSPQYLKFDSTGPKLPALVEAACQAMQTC